MTRSRRILWIAALALSAGCAGQVLVPGPDDAARAQARWPGTTVAELARGRALFVDHCSGCHTLPRPDRHPPSRWSSYVIEMEDDAKLDDDSAQAVIRFLTIASERTAAAGRPAAAEQPAMQSAVQGVN